MGWNLRGFLCVPVIALLAVAPATVGGSEERAPRVLIIYPYDERLPSTDIAGETARERLTAALDGKVDLFSEFLDLSRFPDPDHVASMARYLAEKYQPVRPDVVIALGAESIGFMVANRATIAPDARIVYAGISKDEAERLKLPADIAGALTEFDVTSTFELARALQPDARKIVVMGGSAQFDKSWLEAARSDFSDLPSDYSVTYVTDVSIDEFVRRAAELPANTIVLVLSIFKDAEGTNFVPREAVARIAAASAAPVYGPYSTYIGQGIVGTSTFTFEAMGTTVADLALKVLDGKPSADAMIPQTYLADARQLAKWGLPESRLPEGTEVSFREKSLWEEHRLAILSTLGIVLVQAAIISALLLERRRRAAAQHEARTRLLEVVHLNQSATAGALSASIAHELNQPLGAIRNNAEAAEIILRSDKPDLELIRQILVDIRDDDQRAGDIIGRLRGMLKKRGEIEWQEFDVNEVVESALQLLHSEAERRRVEIDCERTTNQLRVRADRVHLQQVILNIATNAMDAMLSSAPAQRRLMFRTDVREGSKAAISIADTGTGIPSDKLSHVFETFYTTKTTGTGLGLSIARAIVETYGGHIWAANRPEGGAVVSFDLPLVQH